MKYLLLIIPFFLVSCATPAGDPPPITEADTGKTVHVASGGAAIVTLAGNPTTGYSWSLLSGDDAILQSVGDPVYTAAPASAGLAGGGGTFTFKLRAVGRGTAMLKFGYSRPFEKNVPPVKTFAVTVIVP